MKELRTRKKNRLRGYDYSSIGSYFITICVKDMHEMFGIIPHPVGADIIRPQLSAIGEIVENAINKISHVYPSVTVDSYIIMPNHIHMILIIAGNGRISSARKFQQICCGRQSKEWTKTKNIHNKPEAL